MNPEAKATGYNKNYANYFRYEMKDTNQLLKDFISCNMNGDFLGSEPAKYESTQFLYPFSGKGLP